MRKPMAEKHEWDFHWCDPLVINTNVNVGGVLTIKHVIIPTPPSDTTLRAVFTAKCGGFTVKGQSPMSYTLPVAMQIALAVSYVDAKGNPAQVDGDTDWSSSDQSIATVTVDPSDSTKATVVSVDLGQAQITCRADADLGEGQDEIMGTLDVEVVAGQAVSAQITPSGSPTPAPDPTPPDPNDPNAPQVNPLSRGRTR